MEFDLKKLVPWNWFKKEQEQDRAQVPVQRAAAPAASAPVHPVMQLQREIDRLFEEAFRGFGMPSLAGFPATTPSLSQAQGLLRPALDIQETDKEYRISLEVPGVEEKDIQITLDDDVLYISGEKRQETEANEGGFHRIERVYGSFQRVLNLPEDADPDAIKASFRNGVLTITVGRRETRSASGARQIPVQS